MVHLVGTWQEKRVILSDDISNIIILQVYMSVLLAKFSLNRRLPTKEEGPPLAWLLVH